MNERLLLAELIRIMSWNFFLNTYNFNGELEVEAGEEEKERKKR